MSFYTLRIHSILANNSDNNITVEGSIVAGFFVRGDKAEIKTELGLIKLNLEQVKIWNSKGSGLCEISIVANSYRHDAQELAQHIKPGQLVHCFPTLQKQA